MAESRVEDQLHHILGDEYEGITPMSRIEVLLQRILDGEGDVTQEEIAEAVSSYLDENLTNPTNPPIDSSLTIAGAAADAKATGDNFSQLNADIIANNLQSLKYITRYTGMMNYGGTSWMYTSDENYQHVIIPVTAGDLAVIKANGTGSYWTFLQSYSTSVAPVLSTETPTRQNTDYSGRVPSDATYLYINVKNNGTETLPTRATIDGWDYCASAKSEILSAVESVENAVIANTPSEIIKDNLLYISETSWTNGTVTIGFKEPNIITLSGTYSSGAVRITLQTASLKANTTYTFMVKNSDGLVPTVGLGSNSGFVTYNNEKVETTDWNTAIQFTVGDSDLSGVYAYLRVTAATLDNELSIYIIEGELESDDFFIYDKKYTASRLYGKTVAWYGDSIVQGYEWCELLNERFGFVGTNCGSGGCRVTYVSSRDDSMYSTDRMQGDYTPTSGTATAIPDDVDIIFVEGGTNDWGNSVPVGDAYWVESPDYTVFSEACHLMFDNLTTLYPDAEIIVLGSPWAKWASHFTDTYGILNNNGLQTVDYGDTLLDVAGRWGIKGINMSRLLALNDNNIATYTSDGIHPNTDGAEIIADAVEKYLLTL